jgi:hypothetical protein
MNNGEEGSSVLNTKSEKRLRLVMSAGPQPMRRFSGTVRSHQEALEGFTKDLSLRYQSPKKSARSENRKARRRLAVSNSFSMSECAKLDAMGVKILGIEFDIDHHDRGWAQ